MKDARYTAESLFRPSESLYINRVKEMTRDTCIYHSHDFVEICYVCSGKGYHLVDGKEYDVFKGDMFIINYDMTHTFFSKTPKDELITYNIVFKPSFFDNILSGIEDLDFTALSTSFLFNDLTPDFTGQESLRLTHEEQKDFDVLLNNIYQEYVIKPNGYMSIIRAYMIELVIKIVRCLSERENSFSNPAHRSPLVDDIVEYLKEHFSESFSLNALALKSFFSKGYLCKVFKEATGMTMSEYVHMLRINEACRLIESTDMKLTEIAYKAGFPDYKAFTAVFKKVTGKKPGEFRRSFR